MKTFRVLGAVFCVFGCILTLLGVLTSILPLIENEQLKLILSSFQEPSADPLTNTLNAIVLFCLRSGYFLLFCGISVTIAGGLISTSAHKLQKAETKKETVHEIAMKPLEPASAPKPAYYPGGAQPPSLNPVPDEAQNASPLVSTTMKLPKIELITDTDDVDDESAETDGEKLMRNDAVLSAQEQFMRPSKPDYSNYPSNTSVSHPEGRKQSGSQPRGSNRPRIVSTMGKRPL